MRIRTTVAAALLAAGVAVPAQAQEPRSLVAACFTCHGTEGRSVGEIPPSLAGRDRESLLQALKEFKAGKRPAMIMYQQAKGYIDQEFEIMASYFAGVKAGAVGAAPRY
jgi:sulfide dehydrogenase cytochrome subunit